ncbi:DUF3885 domain-containing protein [Myroides odoratimimus]|uniref:DUF3885 domain-containing protein n=1 Tax=Myroides odoratimimus TaxID=76832 RepID=UPI00092151ED|nr:hypothetical protein [Myroides odoratimimus]SHM03124.1 hypothetical protein SAMN05444275_108183 [Myroides odoratimimus subsp. xuanwuensis]
MVLKEFDEKAKSTFGICSFETIKEVFRVERISFSEDNVFEILEVIIALIEKYFKSGYCYVRITFWDLAESDSFSNNCLLIEINDDSAVGLYHFNLKDEGLKQLLLSHLNYELGLEPSINITAFFINFEDKIVVNVFDDRGLDYLVIND